MTALLPARASAACRVLASLGPAARLQTITLASPGSGSREVAEELLVQLGRSTRLPGVYSTG